MEKEQDRNSFFFFYQSSFLYVLELHYTPYSDIKKPTSAKIVLIYTLTSGGTF
ncbi:MAG: hypothetical protein PHF41_12345 [Massilibacteroides sp.]|nr:hypothetical protein [Massilibacteroides sp.]